MTSCQPLQAYFGCLLADLDIDSNVNFPCTIVSDNARSLPQHAAKSTQQNDRATPLFPPTVSRWDNTTALVAASSSSTSGKPSLPQRQVSIELTSFQKTNSKPSLPQRQVSLDLTSFHDNMNDGSINQNNQNNNNSRMNDDSSNDKNQESSYYSDNDDNSGIDICLSSRRWSSELPPQTALKRPERSPVFAKTESWSSLNSLSSSSSEVVTTVATRSRCT